MEKLKQQRQWVCWNYEERNGERKKVPCAANGKHVGTSKNYQKKWMSYDEAVKAKDQNNFDGIGFVLPDSFFLLDIDHRGDGDQFTEALLKRFASYSERSPSGNGTHIIGCCDLDRIPTLCDENGKPVMKRTPKGSEYLQLDGYKMRSKDLELYLSGFTGRFATFTGNVINDIPIRNCTDAFLETLDQYLRRPTALTKQPTKVQENNTPLNEDDIFRILCDARKARNGEKFSQLYDDGDWSTYYASQSEADAGLCAMLAFWTGNNPDAIDTLFRTSALYRDKWERDDYREETIRGAIAACHGVFHWSTMELPPFIRISEKKVPRVVPTLLADYIRETENYILVQNSSEEGMMIFVFEGGCYKLYSKERMLGLIKHPVEEYNRELVSMSPINEVYNQIRTDLSFVPQDRLNADEHLINFENGLLHVTPDDLTLLPHREDYFSTVQIPCRWTGRETSTPVFDSYIDTLTNHDPATVKLLLEYIGAVISNVKGWRFKKALFLVGDGDTGKSVLKNLVERILGTDNYAALDLEQMEARFGTSRIYLKRLAGSADMGFMAIPQLRIFKQATGGDSIFAENKGQQGFSFVYNGFLWFCTNRLPKFGGDDGQWVYDRIMIIRCVNVIPPDQQDKELLDKLYAEREGIVYKAIKALQTVIAAGYRFSEPDSVISARRDYLVENNSVIGFFDECLTYDPTLIPADASNIRDIYETYKIWCNDNTNGHPKSCKEFEDTIARHLGFTRKDMKSHNARGVIIKGLKLTEETGNYLSQTYQFQPA